MRVAQSVHQLRDGAASIAVGSVSAYEKGEKSPPVDVANRIATALGVSLDWLFNESMTETDLQSTASSVGDAARAFVTLVKAGFIEEATTGYAATDLGLRYRLTIDLSETDPLTGFVDGIYKLRKLLMEQTIDQDIFQTWLSKKLEELDAIPLAKD